MHSLHLTVRVNTNQDSLWFGRCATLMTPLTPKGCRQVVPTIPPQRSGPYSNLQAPKEEWTTTHSIATALPGLFFFFGTHGPLLGIQHAAIGPHELGSVRPTKGGDCNSNPPQNRSGVSEETRPKQGHRLQEGELNPNMTCQCVTSSSASVYSWRLMDQEVLS